MCGWFWKYLFSACALAALFSLSAKEIAATLPISLFFYEWFFFQNLSTGWLKKKMKWTIPALVGGSGLALLYLGTDPFHRILDMYQKLHFSPVERVLTEGQIVLYYLSLLLFPHPARLQLLYDFPLASLGMGAIPTILSMLALFLLALAALPAVRKASAMPAQRFIAFALLWFFLNLAIESSFLGLALIYEHRTYLPSVFPLMAAVFLMFHFLRPKLLAIGLLTIVGVTWGFWAWQRNHTWLTMPAFWQDCAAKSPLRPDAHNNLGLARQNEGQPEPAIRHYQTALGLLQLTPLEEWETILADYQPARYIYKARPESILANWGRARQQTGDPDRAARIFRKALQITPAAHLARRHLAEILLQQGKTDEAIRHLETAIQTAPNPAAAIYLLARAREQKNQPQQAVLLYQEALSWDPHLIDAYNHLGTIHMKSGKPSLARHYFQQALIRDPENGIAQSNLGGVLLALGRTKEARKVLEKAVQLAPDYAKAHKKLAIACYRQGQINQAIRALHQALQADPAYQEAAANLQQILAGAARQLFRPQMAARKTGTEQSPEDYALIFALGQWYEKNDHHVEAIASYQQALRIRPEAVPCLNRLAGLYNQQGKLALAAELLQKTARLLPDTPTVFYNLACLYAKQHQLEKAVACLQTAIKKGYNKWQYLRTDPDLNNIRNTAGYRQLIKKQQTVSSDPS